MQTTCHHASMQVAGQMQVVICAEAPLQLPKVHAAIFELDALPLPTAVRLLQQLAPQVL